MRRFALILAGLSLVCATLGGVPRASAAPSPQQRADAKALVAKAKLASKAGHFSEAADDLAKAEALDPSPQTELDLGRALVSAKRLVDARRTLKALAGAGTANAKIVAAAKKALVDVEARLAWLKVTTTPADARVTIDGASVDTSAEVPLDAGDHNVAVEADGYSGETRSVKVAEAAHDKTVFDLAHVGASGPVAKDTVHADGGGSSKAPAAVAFGLGGVGLGVGAVFGILAFNASSSAKAKCNGNDCPPSAASDIDASKRDGNVSTVAFIIGGAGVAAGAILLLVAPSKKDPPPPSDALAVHPWVGVGRAGLEGTF